ncbi:MAG: rhodanese-like domain-containing protein [Planctomycetales bacterium]|nr:rhodanese-like domain-containing protein [Planctomycetales bacterium]
MAFSSISVQELHKHCACGEDLRVIDVRTPAEFRTCHATVAQNFPLESLDPKQVEAAFGSHGPFYVICKGGNRSRAACQKLEASGLNVINVEGGTSAWQAAGYPVVRGAKSISLERQVRILVGVLVVLGVALSPIHWSFAILSAIMGAGLVFSGVTDTCPMSMTLARAPWNQVSDSSSCAASPAPSVPNSQ